MGIRGPKPLPNAERKRRGTYRADRHAGEPHAPAGTPLPPPWISGAALVHWNRYAGYLEQSKLLTVLDTTALGLLCNAIVDYLLARDILEEEAKHNARFVVSTDKGNLIQHPVVAVMQRAHERLLKLLREFGMTPSARSAMRVPPPKDEQRQDPLTQLFQRFGQAPL